MFTVFAKCLWSRREVVLAIGMLGLFLIGGGGSEVRAQASGDTSRTRPARVEPAGLDSLPGGARIPPRSSDTPRAAADTGDAERVYVNADSLSALRRGGERIQELFGNVFIRQDTTQLRSDYARRYLERDVVLFTDDVVVYERGDTLRADTVRYDRRTEVGKARGHVRLTDGEVVVRSERGTYYAAEKRSVFPDSVTLVDSSRVLQAHHGTYWSDERRAEFGGDVRLTEPGTTILADSLTYYRDLDRSVAQGNVFIDRRRTAAASADSTTRTYLFGHRVDNREQRRYSRVEGNALLLRIRTDSTGTPTDTLGVRAHRLEAFRTDTHRRLVAVDSVRIWQSNLAAVADSAVYDRVVAPRPDSAREGEVPIDTTRPPPPDSMKAIAEAAASDAPSPTQASIAEDTLDRAQTPPGPGGTSSADARTASPAPGPSVPTDTTALPDSLAPAKRRARSGRATRSWTTPTAQSEEELPLEEIRLFRSPMTWFEKSQVWGDSIRVRARHRSPDTVFVRGSAFAAQRDSVLDRIHQLKARTITAFFRSDSLRRIRGQPNARVIRFLASEKDSLSGAAQASGDWVVLRFLKQNGKRIKFGPGIEGTWYPKAEDIPEPFELEGFRWVPERRPTRAIFLRDGRVRRRLDLERAPRPRPVAQRDAPWSQTPARRPDSVAGSSSGSPPFPRTVPDGERPRPDSLRARPSARPDSIPPPPRPAPPPDTSATKFEPHR